MASSPQQQTDNTQAQLDDLLSHVSGVLDDSSSDNVQDPQEGLDVILNDEQTEFESLFGQSSQQKKERKN